MKADRSRLIRESFIYAATIAEPRFGSGEWRWYRYALAIADAIQRVGTGEITRLMIMCPPRLGKTTLASGLGVAWWLVRRPDTPVIMASSTEKLAKRFSRDAQRYFVAMGGRLDPASRALGSWRTSANGGLWASGVGGATSGVGAKLMVLDDLVTGREDADSPHVRERAVHWLQSVVWPRLEPPGERVIVIGTRWHEGDPIGWMLDQERGSDSPQGWHILMLDHEFDPDDRDFPASCTVLPDWRTEPGELVCPERWSREKVEEIKAFIGPREWSALHQGRPKPTGGLMFRRHDFRVVDAAPASEHVVRGWDLASTDSPSSDRTAGVKVAQVGEGGNRRWYVLHVVADRWRPHDRDKAIVNTAMEDGESVRHVIEQERGSAGLSVVSQLTAAMAPMRAEGVLPTGDKEVRAQSLASQAEAGNVHVVRGSWNKRFLDEIEIFPAGRHDDQVDACVHAFNTLAGRGHSAGWEDIY